VAVEKFEADAIVDGNDLDFNLVFEIDTVLEI